MNWNAPAEERSGLIGSLEEERQALQERIAEMEVAQAEREANAAEGEVIPTNPALLEELDRLRRVEETIDGLRNQYRAYANTVDAEALTPGLLERIKLYDRARRS